MARGTSFTDSYQQRGCLGQLCSHTPRIHVRNTALHETHSETYCTTRVLLPLAELRACIGSSREHGISFTQRSHTTGSMNRVWTQSGTGTVRRA